MAQKFIFIIKAILLTEALTHAVRSWEIFEPPRSWLKHRSIFIARLLNCFECSSVWISTLVLCYLAFVEFLPFTLLIIVQRSATLYNIAINYLDALRASTISKI